MPVSPVYASPQATCAIRRQRGQGYYNRATELIPLLFTQVSPVLNGTMTSRGIEIGSGTISEQASVKQNLAPAVQLSGNLQTNALMNLLAALGYRPVQSGVAHATPAATTLASAASRNRQWINLASTTSYAVGDLVQVDAVPTIASTDRTEVHKVLSIPGTAASEIQVITLYGGATGGTFTLTYGANTTAALAYNAAAATIQTALQGLASIGAGNATVAGSAGGPWTVTFASALANIAVGMISGNGDSLTGGTGYGANAGLPGQTSSWVDVQSTTEGHTATGIKFEGRLWHDHATAAAVKRLSATAPLVTQFWHVTPDLDVEQDGFSLVVKFSNGVDTFLVEYFDGRAANLNFTFSLGNIASFSCDLRFIDLAVVSSGSLTYKSDVANVVLANTRGSYTYLGQSVNPPRGINITMQTEIPEDFALFNYKSQSVVHTGHSFNMTADGKFIKDFSDKINFNGGGAQITVSDVIPTYATTFNFQSQTLTTDGTTPYALKLVAPDVQYGDYNPQLSTNQFIVANVGMIKVTPSSSNADNWYWELTGITYGDYFGSL